LPKSSIKTKSQPKHQIQKSTNRKSKMPKLQKTKHGYLLSIPPTLVKLAKWQGGDELAIVPAGRDELLIKRLEG